MKILDIKYCTNECQKTAQNPLILICSITFHLNVYLPHFLGQIPKSVKEGNNTRNVNSSAPIQIKITSVKRSIIIFFFNFHIDVLEQKQKSL